MKLSKENWTHYLYRIDFVDGYFYYGMRKRRSNVISPYDDTYWGSPGKVAKPKWLSTMYQKTIVAFLWVDDTKHAGKLEDEMIRSNGWNTHFCLNGSLGHNISDAITIEAGRRGGQICKEKKRGYCDPEVQSRAGKIGGVVGMKKVNKMLTTEARSKNASKAHRTRKEQDSDRYFEAQRHASDGGGSKQFFICTKTGHLSNATGLGRYHQIHGISGENKIALTPEEIAFIMVWGEPIHFDRSNKTNRKWYCNKEGERLMRSEHPGEEWKEGMEWKE